LIDSFKRNCDLLEIWRIKIEDFDMKGFKKRAPLALWKVIMIVVASLIGVAGATALVLFLTGRLDDKINDPEDMAFMRTVDGQGFAENIDGDNWFFLADDSELTISCTTEGVTETKVSLSLKNGVTRNGKITDGVITIPNEVELNKPFKVELVRRNGSIVGSVDGYSYITAKSQNILLPTRNAIIAVDTPVSEINLAVGSGAIAKANEMQNVVVGSTFNIDTLFTPENSKYLFNNKNTSKKVFYQVLGSDGVNYITYNENEDGSYTFYADEVSGNKYSIVNAYAFSNSYFEKLFFDQNPNATTDEIVAFLQNEANAAMVVSQSVNIKVLDIEVADVIVEPSKELAEVFVDKYFTLSTNSTDRPNDMSLGISIFDSGKKPAQVLLGRVGIKVPKGKADFSILGGRVMKVTTKEGNVVVEEETFDPDFDYSKAAEGVEYYILPRTGADIDYNNYYWSFASSSVMDTFKLEINFFHKDETGLWRRFFENGQEESINVLVKDGNNSVSLTADSLDLVINYDDNGKPIPAELELSADIGNSIYTRVAYFLYDNTRDGSVDIKDVFNCKEGVVYSKDYRGQNINISGVTPRENYTLYELFGNRLVVNKSYSGSVVVIAALVRTDVNGNLIPDSTDPSKYQLVCFSGAKVVNVDSTLSISNMTPTFSFKNGEPAKYNNQYYLPAINKNEDGSTKDMITFTLKLTSEDIAKDVEKVMAAYGKTLNVICCDRDGNAYQEQYLSLGSFAELVDQRTANMAVFEGTIIINEDFFTAGKNAVDQGKAISFKLTYDDGKEEREKLVGMNDPIDDGVVDYFYVYFQQPKELKVKYSETGNYSAENPIVVQISSGANGLQIDWGQMPLTAENYQATIDALNSLLTYTIVDQFGQEIKATDGVYSVQFNEERRDSNNVLVFDEEVAGSLGIPAKIKDFNSTNGKVVSTNLKVYVVDRKNGNEKVMAVNPDNTLSNVEMQSEMLTFEVSSEGLDYVKYDKTTDVTNTEDDSRFEDAPKNESKIVVTKHVSEDDEIILSNLFRIYTTGNSNANTDYQIVFDGTWLQDFQSGVLGVELKKMFQINDEAGNVNEQKNITEYANVPITKLKLNAPINPLKETKLTFRINSTNNLYSVTLNLYLTSDIEVNRSFENYETKYSEYLTDAPNESVSVFADESYNLDEYLVFNSSKYSWAKALVGKGLDLGSKESGIFFEKQGIASLNVVSADEIRLDIAAVRQYTSITIKIYYGVRSEYAFYTEVELYVNPNIIIEEKVNSLDENPILDLTQVASENVANYYSVWKATSYIRELAGGGTKEAVSLDGGTTYLSAKNLIYVRKDNDGFLTIKSGSDADGGGKFAFVDRKNIDVMNSYIQAFSLNDATDSALDAVKIKVDKDNAREVVKYSSKDRITIAFSVCYNQSSIDELITQVFPEASVVQYQGQTRLLILKDRQYSIADGFNIKAVEGRYIDKNSQNQLVTKNNLEFVDHDNKISVSTDVSDGTTKLEINLVLGVTVTNTGNEFVYYTNKNGEFNIFADENGNSLVDFDKLISANPNDLENEGVYETMVAGKSYKILHDIGTEYTRTTDTEIDPTKTYYIQGKSSFVVVESPSAEYLASYFEKNAPQAGFYYDSVLLEETGARREFSVEIVSDAYGYLNNLARYTDADRMLHINSMEAGLEGYILLKFTMKVSGTVSSNSYSWYYRIKVVSNFEIGNVNYPYNESSSENYGEYLDINSHYYNAETLTYTIDLDEKFNNSNSGRVAGSRFDKILWTTLPEGVITENYRLKSASSNAVSVSFDGRNISIAYRSESDKNSAVTIVIQKYWCVDDVEVVGSEMEYTFKLNQAKTYDTSLYRGEVKDENKVGADNVPSYDATIIAGSKEQIFIPSVREKDGEVTGDRETYGSYIKGNPLDLIDALKFKKVWIAEGTEVTVKMPITEELKSLILDSNEVLIEETDWIYANIETSIVDEKTKTNLVVYFANPSENPNQTYKIEDGKLWFSKNISVGESVYSAEIGVKLEDLIVEYLEKGLQEYFTTSDKNRVSTKTYYVIENGEYVEAVFEDGVDFEENTQYYEKYKNNPYETIILNPKDNISKDSTFELGIYTSEGIVFKINLKAESYFEWTLGEKTLASGKHYTFKNLITELSTKDENRKILDVGMSLTNGNDFYREYYPLTDDERRFINKTYYVLKDGKYQIAEFSEDEGFTAGVNYYERVNLKVSDMIVLSGMLTPDEEDKLNLDDIKLEIAPLVKDVNLKFDVTIKSASKDNLSDVSLYSFELEFVATKNFDENVGRQVQDTEWRYGQRPFSVIIINGDGEVGSVVTPKIYSEDAKPSKVSLIATENTTYKFGKGDGYSLVDKASLQDNNPELKITPDDVEEEMNSVYKTLTLVGMFKGKEISRFQVSYRYQIAKNVIINTNYPNPDEAKENTSSEEYISATTKADLDGSYVSTDFKNFFNTPATFASKDKDGKAQNRVNVYTAKKDGDTYVPYIPNSEEGGVQNKWTVSVSDITSNLKVSYSKVDNGKTVTGDVDSTSDEKARTILTNSLTGEINLKFTLLDVGKVESVTFKITVNKVSALYTVKVVNAPIIKVSTNTPNYNQNREEIYAEDLAKSEEQEIFAENRLLNYNFKGSALLGETYYVRLANTANTAENKIVPITVNDRGVIINIDLGKSFKTFKYFATYRSLEGAQAGNTDDVISDEEIYTTAPNLTSRIVVKYYDDRAIKLSEENYIKLGTNIGWNKTQDGYIADTILNSYIQSQAKALKAKDTLAVLNGVRYIKAYSGDAYAGYFSGIRGFNSSKPESLYSGVILLSNDKNAAKVCESNYSGGIVDDVVQTIYLSVNNVATPWYVYRASIDNYQEGKFSDASGLSNAIKLSGSTWDDCLQDLLQKTIYGYKKIENTVLSTSDYLKEKRYEIAVQVGGENGQTIFTNSQYAVYLKAEFGVSESSDSSTTPTAKTINAGEELSLLDGVDFGIYNARTGHKYSNSGAANTDNFKDSGGNVDLKIYGLPGLAITQAPNDSLTRAAYEIHSDLKKAPQNYDSTKDVIFKTGLTPRANGLNTGFNCVDEIDRQGIVESGSIDLNYLTYSDIVEGGKKVDFSIRARGANNDGNHVMMRITYTVNFGENSEAIVIAHNLLFKVMPNSSITFLTRHNSTASTTSANEVVGGQSYASNKESAYSIQNDDNSKGYEANVFYLWKKDNKEGSLVDNFNLSAIQAKMYKNNTLNNANTFEYTYEYSGDRDSKYNSFLDSVLYLDDEPAIPEEIKLDKKLDEFKVSLKELMLGDRQFYIDGVNEYGFRIRFYFTLSATEKPVVDSLTIDGEATDIVQEGQAVVVGAKYLPVAPAKIAVDEGSDQQWYQLLGTINYVREDNNNSGKGWADTILNIPGSVTKLYLSAETDTPYGTVIKKIGSISSGSVNIWQSSGKWKFADDSEPVIKVETGEKDEMYGNPILADVNFNENNYFSDDHQSEDNVQENLKGSRIAIYGLFTNGDNFTTFTNLKYAKAGVGENDLVIEQVYTAEGEARTPTISSQSSEDNNNKSKKALVTLRGISSYAFPAMGEDSIKGLNLDVAEKYKSRVNDIKVNKIEYLLNGKVIGTSVRGAQTNKEGNISLVTNGEYKFYNGKVYEDSYKVTNDTVKYPGKTYYEEKDGSYVIFKGEAFEKDHTYYERVQTAKASAEYVQTSDDSKVESKTYYTYDTNLRQYKVYEGAAFVKTNGYYIKDSKNFISVDTDHTFDSSKTYYTFDINTGKFKTFAGSDFVAKEGYYEKAAATEAATPIDGTPYANDADFMVPVIDSIYFNNSDKLANVEMKIYLVEGENKTTVSKFVTISRLENAATFNEVVKDNTVVGGPTDKKTLLNDTLEVVLDPGESVTFAISDSLNAFKEVPEASACETLSNRGQYRTTEYISISATIDKYKKMTHNFNSREPYPSNTIRSNNDFVLTVLEKTTTKDDIDFVYNGKALQVLTAASSKLQKYQESTDVLIVNNKIYYLKSDTTEGTYNAIRGSAFYRKIADNETLPISGKKYYMLENGVYNLVTAPIASEMRSYYEQVNNGSAANPFYHYVTYNKENAEKYSGKTFYTYENYNYKAVEKPVEGTKYFVQKTYFEMSYKLTSDSKVVAGKNYYLVDENKVYTVVTTPKNEELSTYYERVVSDVYANKTIAAYTGTEIVLNINDYSEISGLESTTARTLYFLYKGTQTNINSSVLNNTNMYYRMSKTFRVGTQYSSLTSDSVDTSGNIEFKVDNYFKAEKSADDFYYVIPRTVWGKKLKLNNDATKTLDAENAYKFTYEINKDVEGGAGGAFIDEEGNIFTDKNFDIQGSTITVNVYMKVSGQNRFYDVNSTKLKLCQFRMMLAPTDLKSSISTQDTPGEAYRELSSGGFITIPTGYTIYNCYKNGTLPTYTLKDIAKPAKTLTLACEVGDKLDFGNMRSTLGITDAHHNVYYHVAQDEHTVNGKTTKTVLYYNNMGSYKVETAGTHKLTIVVSYRDAFSGKVKYLAIAVEIMAYDEYDRTDSVKMIFASKYAKTADTTLQAGKTYYVEDAKGQYVAVAKPNTNELSTYFELTEKQTFALGTGDWYTFAEDGTITYITEKDESGRSLYVAPGKTGIYYQSFVAKDTDGNTRTYSYQFYVVSGESVDVSKEVVLSQGATYNLANLYEGENYRFYKVLGDFDNGSDHTDKVIREISIETGFKDGANSNATIQYIVRDDNGKHFRIKVTYRFTTSDSATTDSIFVERGADLATVIKDAVEAKLQKSLNNKTIKVLTENGKPSVKLIGKGDRLSLESGTADTEDESIRIDDKKYLVAYQITENLKTETRYVRYNPTIYLYDDSADLTIYTKPNNNFELMQTSEEILKAFNLSDKKDVTIVSFSEFNTSGSLVPTSTAVLGGLENGNIEKEYLIQVTYKEQVGEGEEKQEVTVTKNLHVNLTFSNYSVVGDTKNLTFQTTAQNNFDLQTCNQKVLELLKDVDNVSSVSYFKLSVSTLVSTTTVSLEKLAEKDIVETLIVKVKYTKTEKVDGKDKVVEHIDYYQFKITFTIATN